MIISPAYFASMAEVPTIDTGIITEEYFKAVEKGDIHAVKELFREKKIQATSYEVQ